MDRNTVSGTMLTLLLVGTLALAFYIQPVKAVETVYIRADGSVYPSTAPIQRDRDLYTLTNNITSSAYYDGIVIQRDNMTLDGAGYTLEGVEESVCGLYIWAYDNVTIKNLEIRQFEYGIIAVLCQNLVLSQNILADNYEAFYIDSDSGAILSGNIMNGNTYSIGVGGNSLNEFMHSIDTSNHVDGKPVYYLINQTDGLINPETYPQIGYLGLINCVNMTVDGLNISKNIDGLLLAFTNNSRVTSNNMINNENGVSLWYSSNNTLTGNNVTESYYYGIWLIGSSNNKILGNTFINGGFCIFNSYENSVEGNVVNGKPLVYLEDMSEYVVDYAGEVVLVNCTNIRVENLDLSNASIGLELLGTSNSLMTDNNIENNFFGIFLDSGFNNTMAHNTMTNNTFGLDLRHGSGNCISENNIERSSYGITLRTSSNNTLDGNNISNNDEGISVRTSSNNNLTGNNISDNNYGIEVSYSSNNAIYHNNFINNGLQADSYQSTSVWDDGYPSGGNYWSNYKGWDADGDGVGDLAYVIDDNNRDHYPFMNSWTPQAHDIAVMDLTPSKTVVGKGYTLDIYVTVTNQGIYSHTFNVRAHANGTSIGAQSVTLVGGNSTTLTFTWDTTSFAKGSYNISAAATAVPGEIDVADNTLIDGIVKVTTPGDVNADGIVNIVDAGGISAHWYPVPPIGPLGYDPNFDVNGDGNINVPDAAIISAYWTGPPKGPLAP